MLIKLSDIEVGDVILIANNSQFKILKVLSLPKKQDSSTYRCSQCIEHRNYSLHSQYTYKVHVMEENTSKHNDKISVNLYGRAVWLIKKENFI